MDITSFTSQNCIELFWDGYVEWFDSMHNLHMYDFELISDTGKFAVDGELYGGLPFRKKVYKHNNTYITIVVAYVGADGEESDYRLLNVVLDEFDEIDNVTGGDING